MTIEEIIDYIHHKIEDLETNEAALSYLYSCGRKDSYLDILEMLKDHKEAFVIKDEPRNPFKYPVLTAEEIENG